MRRDRNAAALDCYCGAFLANMAATAATIEVASFSLALMQMSLPGCTADAVVGVTRRSRSRVAHGLLDVLSPASVGLSGVVARRTG